MPALMSSSLPPLFHGSWRCKSNLKSSARLEDAMDYTILSRYRSSRSVRCTLYYMFHFSRSLITSSCLVSSRMCHWHPLVSYLSRCYHLYVVGYRATALSRRVDTFAISLFCTTTWDTDSPLSASLFIAFLHYFLLYFPYMWLWNALFLLYYLFTCFQPIP